MALRATLPTGVELQPLHWPGRAYPNESLIGLISRRGAEHYLGSNRLILMACDIDVRHQGEAIVHATPKSLQELSRILGIDEMEIRKKACAPIGEDHSGKLVQWGKRSMRLRDIEMRYRRISPSSLQHSDHHRQSWLLRLLPYCPESFEELTDNCPGCHGKLRWSAAQPVGRCDREDCVHAKGSIPATGNELPIRMREAYAFFSALLSADEEEATAARSRFHPDLRDIENPTLIDLVFLLADIDRPQGRRANTSTIRDSHAVDIAERATKGTEALLEWPSCLEQLAARAINNRKSERHLWSRLKSAANNHPNLEVRDLVISGAPVIAEGLREAVAPDSPPVMLQTELVRLTGISAEQGAFLSKGDFLRSPAMVGDAGSSKLDRALCEDFIQQREASERNETVATRLLLPTYAIMQMGRSARLDRPSNPGLNALEPQTRIMTASVERLVAELASLDVSDGTEELLSIGAASRIIGGGLKPWDEIIGAILDGHLPCLRAKGDPAPTTRSLVIRRKDLGMLAKMTRKPRSDFNVPLIASQQDAMEILNATFSQMTRLRSNRMLNFEQAYKKLACPMAEVLALAETRIFSAELSLRTGIAPNALKAWCDARGVVERPEGGFCRVQIDRLQPV